MLGLGLIYRLEDVLDGSITVLVVSIVSHQDPSEGPPTPLIVNHPKTIPLYTTGSLYPKGGGGGGRC